LIIVRFLHFSFSGSTTPISDISDRSASGIYLNLDKDELKQQYGEGGKAQADSGTPSSTMSGDSGAFASAGMPGDAADVAGQSAQDVPSGRQRPSAR
jgi:hypothetical protein